MVSPYVLNRRRWLLSCSGKSEIYDWKDGPAAGGGEVGTGRGGLSMRQPSGTETAWIGMQSGGSKAKSVTAGGDSSV